MSDPSGLFLTVRILFCYYLAAQRRYRTSLPCQLGGVCWEHHQSNKTVQHLSEWKLDCGAAPQRMNDHQHTQQPRTVDDITVTVTRISVHRNTSTLRGLEITNILLFLYFSLWYKWNSSVLQMFHVTQKKVLCEGAVGINVNQQRTLKYNKTFVISFNIFSSWHILAINDEQAVWSFGLKHWK